MDNPVLNAEQFSRAVYAFRDFCERFDQAAGGIGESAHTIKLAAESFAESVTKLARVQGMVAENDQRKHLGQSMAYVEKDFLNV